MSSARTDDVKDSGKLLAYLQLFRAPNVFTSMADVAMGFVFVSGSFEPIGGLLCLLLASSLLYTAGMVLNDVYDYDIDLQERPTRPLPSGRIPLAHAQRLGYGLLCGGVVAGALAGYVVTDPAGPVWRSGVIALLLAAAVIGYDGLLKQTMWGPLAMGSCRFLNVLLGMSLSARGDISPLQFDLVHVLVASGIGVYIVGVTWFARTEATQSRRGLLVFGVGIMAAGIMLLAFFPRYAGAGLTYFIEPTFVWPMALFLLTFTILRRCLIAVANPTPQQVQFAVKQCLLSLIVLDAAVALLMAPWIFAVAILALLIPTLVLGKWVYST